MYDMLEYMEGLADEDWHKNYKKRQAEMKMTEVIKKLKNIEKFTPDYGTIRLHRDIIVVVYDDMKSRGLENFILRDSKYLGEVKSTGNNYIMKINPPVAFFIDKTNEKQRGFIRGEAYAVNPITLANLDYYKSNLQKVKRVKKYFFLLDQDYPTKNGTKKPSVEAFVWVGLPAYWNDKAGMYTAPSVSPQGDKSKRYYEYVVASPPSIWNPNRHNFMH